MRGWLCMSLAGNNVGAIRRTRSEQLQATRCRGACLSVCLT